MSHPLTVYRKAQKPPLTQTELARRLGLDRSTICRIENGSRGLSTDALRAIVRATGLSAERLLEQTVARR